MTLPPDNQYRVASLEKGLRVLALLARARKPLRLPEIAKAAGYPTATTYRLLRTLEEDGFVQNIDGQRFSPGPAVLTLGFDTLAGMDIVQVAGPILTKAAEQTGESSNLSVLINHSVVILFRAQASSMIRPTVTVGMSLPPTTTSAGKALLAAMSDAELEAELDAADWSVGGGPNAIRNRDRFMKEIEVTRARGWALQDEEVAFGIRSIAACVYRAGGVPAAAANLSFTASNVDVDTLERKYVPILLEAASSISRLLGHEPM